MSLWPAWPKTVWEVQWLSWDIVGVERIGDVSGSGKNWDQWTIWPLPPLYVDSAGSRWGRSGGWCWPTCFPIDDAHPGTPIRLHFSVWIFTLNFSPLWENWQHFCKVFKPATESSKLGKKEHARQKEKLMEILFLAEINRYCFWEHYTTLVMPPSLPLDGDCEILTLWTQLKPCSGYCTNSAIMRSRLG